MENQFQFFNKTGQWGVPTKSFGTPGWKTVLSRSKGDIWSLYLRSVSLSPLPFLLHLILRNYDLINIIIIIRVFCPRAGPSLQAHEPRLEFCQRQVFHRKLRNQGCSFTRDWIGAVASRCFPHHTLSLASEQTLKDLKRSHGHWRGGEENECS